MATPLAISPVTDELPSAALLSARPDSFAKNARHANWVHAVSHLDPKYGGLSAAVPALSSAIARTGQASVTLAGFCQPSEQFAPPAAEGVAVKYFPVGRLAWQRSPALQAQFCRLVSQSAGVHIHGLWQMSTSVAASMARSEAKPYLISAHGMLEAWALANKRFKKNLYAALFERRNLRSAACLHALTEAEARDYRNFGLRNPIAVIPNGVDVPTALTPDLFFSCFPQLRGQRIVLFLSRIHFKKGLDLLAQAWAKIAAQWPAVHLVLAGPDFENTQAQVEKALSDLGVRDRVTFTGMLPSDLKWSALKAAECFVLPSYSEGLSVSVLEAMGIGLPVILTEQCNLPEVATHGCGWTIQPDVDQLAAALTDLLGSTATERESMGRHGRQLVATRYSWPAIGDQMAAVYSWLTDGILPAGVTLHPEVRS